MPCSFNQAVFLVLESRKKNRCCSDTTTTATTATAKQKNVDRTKKGKTNVNFWDPFKLDANLPFQFRATTQQQQQQQQQQTFCTS